MELEELQKQVSDLSKRIADLERRVKDGKNFVVTNEVCDIDKIAEIIAKRVEVQTVINKNVSDETWYENLNYAQNCRIATDESNLLTQMIHDAHKIADKYDVARINVLHDIAKKFNNALEK